MKVFLCWSGNQSKAVAKALHKWLPQVIQVLDPWMSEESIPKGTFWTPALLASLRECRAGVVCVTPDNHEAPWLNFEAGALANAVEHSNTRVIPYLVGLREADLPSGPLTLFQAAHDTEADTLRMVKTINSAMEKPLTDLQISSAFAKFWPDMKPDLEIPPPPEVVPPRDHGLMLEEILNLVRSVARKTNRGDAYSEALRMARARLAYLQSGSVEPILPDSKTDVAMRQYYEHLLNLARHRTPSSTENDDIPPEPEV